jgi:hypothetical protein
LDDALSEANRRLTRHRRVDRPEEASMLGQ